MAIIQHSRISLELDVLVGKPVIRGTRLSVEFVIGLMAGGGRGRYLGNYPGMTHDDIIACLAYARDILSSEKVFPSAARNALSRQREFAYAAVARIAASGRTRDRWHQPETSRGTVPCKTARVLSLTCPDSSDHG